MTSEETAPPGNLDAVLNWQAVSDDVERRRSINELRAKQIEDVLRPRIQEHLRVYRLALDVLDEARGAIGDRTDLEVQGDSRQAAVWIVSGRCIGHSRALLCLLESGFGYETAVQLRAVHEATRLAAAFSDEDESDLLRRWLSDEDMDWVRPTQTRAAQERSRGRFRRKLKNAKKQAAAAGEVDRAAAIEDVLASNPLTPGESVGSASAKIYDVLSRAAHIRHSGTTDAISVELRTMATGPHPNPHISASYVDYGGRIIEEVLLTIGEIISRFCGPGWFERTIKPSLDALANVRRSYPLA